MNAADTISTAKIDARTTMMNRASVLRHRFVVNPCALLFAARGRLSACLHATHGVEGVSAPHLQTLRIREARMSEASAITPTSRTRIDLRGCMRGLSFQPETSGDGVSRRRLRGQTALSSLPPAFVPGAGRVMIGSKGARPGAWAVNPRQPGNRGTGSLVSLAPN
jgi:hypothetical protein